MTGPGPRLGRIPHYIPPNHRSALPHRWVVLDTETVSKTAGAVRTQTWRLAVATRWRDDLKRDRPAEWLTAADPDTLWEWVADWCRPGKRTILWCHNLAFDLRIARAFEILPALGFTLEWLNLSRDVSVVSWTSDRGGLTMTDTYTWLPTSLQTIGEELGITKPDLPPGDGEWEEWESRCTADVLITATAVRELIDWVREGDLGMWQPSGAGQASSAWRHRFLHHKVLCHDDAQAIDAERYAMAAGRAEAWWHGTVPEPRVTVWDLEMAYCRIARDTSVPRLLYDVVDTPTPEQYQTAGRWYRRLCDVTVTLTAPVLPVRHGGRVLWPVGTFRTVVWDVELDLVDGHGRIDQWHRMWTYRHAPVLAEWAGWTMGLITGPDAHHSPIVRRWAKHTSRALIGRLALRYPVWEPFGDNPDAWTGTSLYSDGPDTPDSVLLHIGNQTLLQGDRVEGSQSLPQITSAIMAECRARVWRAVQAAGPGAVYYMDTDSVMVGQRGDEAMEHYAREHPGLGWRRKEIHRRVNILGPRMLLTDTRHSIAGVPRGAKRSGPGVFAGEVWESMSASLADGRAGSVRVEERVWETRAEDHRRDGPALGWTVPRQMITNSDGSYALIPGQGVG